METKCPVCKSSFNLKNKLPIFIKCGHTVCLQCYKTKMIDNGDGTHTCTIDKVTKFKIKKDPVQNVQLVDFLKKNDYLLITCA